MSAKTLKYLLSEQSASQSEHSNCSILPTSGATYILITHSPPMIPNIHQISQLLLSFVKKKKQQQQQLSIVQRFWICHLLLLYSKWTFLLVNIISSSDITHPDPFWRLS